jgi:hypothetical protein
LKVIVISFKGFVERGTYVSLIMEALVVVLSNLIRPPHELLVAILNILVVNTLLNKCLVLKHVSTEPVVRAFGGEVLGQLYQVSFFIVVVWDQSSW